MSTQTAPITAPTPNVDQREELIRRLKRAEGQVRGLIGMVDKGSYCIDVLTQVAAVKAALGSFSVELLAEHAQTCVTKATDSPDDAAIMVREMADAIGRLVRS
jgi:DNA-binding FrmR family transcriptional regulator